MNRDLERLRPYPFERLGRLKAGIEPPSGLAHISLAMGEPQHTPPSFVPEAIIAHLHGLASYPATRGTDPLREAAADWLVRRFSLPPDSVDPARHVLPVNGTREALFAFAQCMVDRSDNPVVLIPNPFYQIYEGAALMAGAQPWFVHCQTETGLLPDFDSVPEDVWRRCQLLYVCSPGNPTGAVMGEAMMCRLIELADRFDFIIAADECYSEIYFDEDSPPPGLLGVAAQLGRSDWQRCIVFNSLSKRSSVPGLRSGFVAGDGAVMEKFLLYRTYHGCAMAPHTQAASAAAWRDEDHVIENRSLYRDKLEAVSDQLSSCLPADPPGGGFYLWPATPISDVEFARALYERAGVTVLPGSFLSREVRGVDPGAGRVRIALVASPAECVEAAERIAGFIQAHC